MACSKLFSGDLPELINKVIQYFHYDFKTLHSCILVNRLWCRLAIPLLWEDPFSIKEPKNYHFIEIYLHYLNDEYKTKLNEHVIQNELFPSNPLFNYPSLLQRLSTYKVRHSIQKWITTVGTPTTTSNERHSRYFIRSPNLTRINFTKLMHKLLFLIFIENGVNLHSFEVTLLGETDINYFNEFFELILQNPNFINNIKNFKIDLGEITDNIIKLLRTIDSNCNSISSLDFHFPSHNVNFSIIEKSLSQLIKSQENLQKILFGYNNTPLHHSLLSLTYPNCSNTLNTIIFYCIDFDKIVVLNEVFNQLNVLESIHIIDCYSIDSNFIQQISKVTKPFKLKSLFLRGSLQIESLKLLIQKFGNYIENIGIRNKESQLIQLIIKYCSKIKYLGTTWLDNESVHLLFSLIENITRNLNYLTIDGAHCSTSYYFSSIILQNLGQILPFKLKYLYLCLIINTSDLEIFLKNSQNNFIEKLLINSIEKEEKDDIFPYIREYIIKTKRVKYLAILENFNGKNEDLFFQKEKVKESQLHDIEVLNCNDLFINVYDFVKEVG